MGSIFLGREIQAIRAFWKQKKCQELPREQKVHLSPIEWSKNPTVPKKEITTILSEIQAFLRVKV
jgi:hypothetical protein